MRHYRLYHDGQDHYVGECVVACALALYPNIQAQPSTDECLIWRLAAPTVSSHSCGCTLDSLRPDGTVYSIPAVCTVSCSTTGV